MRSLWVVAVVVLVMCIGRPATAQPSADRKATARQLFFDASDALKAGDYAKAADLFHRSNKLFPAPTAALFEGRALVKLGRLVEANERFNSVARKKLSDDASAAFRKAVEEARAEVAELEPRIPGLVITLEGADGAKVMVDEREVPAAAIGVRWLVDPGERVVRATADGYLPFETKVTVPEGETASVTVKLDPDPDYIAPVEQPDVTPAPTGPSSDTPAENASTGPSTLAIAGYVIGGVGIASLVAAGVTGGLFVRQKSVVDDECDDSNRCSQKGLDAVDTGRTLAWINTGTLLGGIGLVAVGVTLVVVGEVGSDEPAAALRATPLPGGGALSLEGRF